MIKNKNMLYVPAWMFVLSGLNKYSYMSEIARKNKLTYSTVDKEIKNLVNLKLIKKIKNGRLCRFKLTKKANNMIDNIDILLCGIKRLK